MADVTILLVDDDVELLKALTKVLEREGYTVVPHPDARSAMDHIQRNRPHLDLVISDVSLPVISGTEFLAKLKNAFPKLPVILITAFGDWGQYMDAMRGGAAAYLSKPLQKTELLGAVRDVLRRKA